MNKTLYGFKIKRDGHTNSGEGKPWDSIWSFEYYKISSVTKTRYKIEVIEVDPTDV